METALREYTVEICDLGEGPIWSAGDGMLYWHDVTGRKLFRQAPDQTAERWDLPKAPGCFGLRRGGGLIAAFRNQLALFDLETGGTQVVDAPGIDFSRERFNDGACDARGRFWVGTFDPGMNSDEGHLYRIDPDFSIRRMDSGIRMSNGLAWSPDGRTLYYSDSRPGQVYRYGFDMESGDLGERQVFLDYADRPGRPDGCTVDAEGFLWVAEVTAGQISRYDPDGSLDRQIALPVSKPTSVAFGGENLRTLFVTSMRLGLSETELEREPLAGCVLRIELDLSGQPEHLFEG